MNWAKIQYLTCYPFLNSIPWPCVYHLAQLITWLTTWSRIPWLTETAWSIFTEMLFAMDDRHLTTRSWDYELSKQQLQPKEYSG
jgi:hypothetical protein